MEQLRQRQERREQRKKEKTVTAQTPATVVEKALQTGDKVRLKGQDAVGEVVKIMTDTVTVGFGNMFIHVPTETLERVSGNEFRKVQKERTVVAAPAGYSVLQRKIMFKPTIDVRGQRADEALDNVTQFIDEALMVGADEVKILHGKGNGILREEIRKLLRTVGGITSVADEHLELGGTGITVVQF
jgi:DNA mismatch repair protein MutS2